MHRLIVTSATYRQSSRVTPQLRERDPANVLLARMPRLRVESEIVRDIAMTASGLLSDRIGVDFTYFVNDEGFSRPMADVADPKGVVWLGGVATVPDRDGRTTGFRQTVKAFTRSRSALYTPALSNPAIFALRRMAKPWFGSNSGWVMSTKVLSR